MFIHLVLLLLSSSILPIKTVLGRRNVTVDDQDPAIVYVPVTSWALSATSNLSAGGAHMLTQDPTATATFTFTGVAIYFMSPLWPYLVNTAVSLDSAPPVLLDLVDHSRPNVGQGMETVQSQVVWEAVGLTNSQHKLVVSIGPGQPFAIVDMLIYTLLDPEDTTTAMTSPISTSVTTTRSSSPTSDNTAVASTSGVGGSSSSTHALPIALGTILGALGLLIIAVAIWFGCRRRKRPVSEAWSVSSPYPSPSAMATAPPFGSSNHPYSSPHGLPYPSDNGWEHQQYGNMTNSSTRAGPPLASVSQPYKASDPQQGYDSWYTPMQSTPPPQVRAPNRYQPNTLSTITETSTPPIGGGTPLAHSPASNQSEIYYDAQGGSERSTVQNDSRSGNSPYAVGPPRIHIPSDRPLPSHPPTYTPN